jgi:hypothetical protein
VDIQAFYDDIGARGQAPRSQLEPLLVGLHATPSMLGHRRIQPQRLGKHHAHLP